MLVGVPQAHDNERGRKPVVLVSTTAWLLEELQIERRISHRGTRWTTHSGRRYAIGDLP